MVVKNWKPILAIVAVAALIYYMAFHWGRFLLDFWPIDSSRVGPNLLASVVQYAIILITVALLYPPARRAIEKYLKRHVNEIKHHVSAEHDALHEKLDHMMKHHAKAEVRNFTPTKERP